MMVLDANIFLYAANKGSPHYALIRGWLEQLAASGAWIGLPWISLWAFLRISTNPRALTMPLSSEEAFDLIGAWLMLPHAITVGPGPRHADVLQRLAKQTGVIGPHFTDAALAAIAIEHGASLASTDRGFGRFAGLDWVNPLDQNAAL